MYPQVDFRSVILSDSPLASKIRSFSREPFSEIISYWISSGRPEDQYRLYCQGLMNAIANDRYPCFVLDGIGDTPEFYECVLNGLICHWLTLGFALRFDLTIIDNKQMMIPTLLVGFSHVHPTKNTDMIQDGVWHPVNLSNELKLRVLNKIDEITMTIDDLTYSAKIELSPHAKCIKDKITFLRNSVSSNLTMI